MQVDCKWSFLWASDMIGAGLLPWRMLKRRRESGNLHGSWRTLEQPGSKWPFTELCCPCAGGLVAQSCPSNSFVTLYTITCQTSVHRISQARIVQWDAMPSSRGSSWCRDWTWSSALTGDFFTAELPGKALLSISSVQFSSSVMSGSLRPHGLHHARLPCPSPTPGACSNSCLSSLWCHPAISSSVVPFSSRLQSFLASGSFLESQLFTSGGQSIGASALASVLPMSIQD